MTIKRFVLLAAVVSILALAVSCGGGDDDDDDDDDDDGGGADIEIEELGPAATGEIMMTMDNAHRVIALLHIDGDLSFGTLGDDGWDIETVGSADNDAYVDWDVTADGDPVVCVADGTSIAVYTKGADWNSETLDETAVPGASFRNCGISVEAGGALHIVYADTVGGMKYTTNENGPWGGATLEQIFGEVAWPRVHVDGGGTVHVVYMGRDGAVWRVRYGKIGGTGFEAENIADAGPEAQTLRMATDPADRMVFAFRNFIDESISISEDGASPQAVIESDAGLDFGLFVSADGALHLGYQPLDTLDWYYATDGGDEWTERSVHTSGDIGYGGGVAVDVDDRVHTLYIGDGKLWYADFS